MPDPTPIPAEAFDAAFEAIAADTWLTDPTGVDVPRHVAKVVAPIFFAAGRAEGRTAAAADIRDAPYPDPSPCIPAWHAGYTEAWERAARVAENGADHV